MRPGQLFVGICTWKRSKLLNLGFRRPMQYRSAWEACGQNQNPSTQFPNCAHRVLLFGIVVVGVSVSCYEFATAQVCVFVPHLLYRKRSSLIFCTGSMIVCNSANLFDKNHKPGERSLQKQLPLLKLLPSPLSPPTRTLFKQSSSKQPIQQCLT